MQTYKLRCTYGKQRLVRTLHCEDDTAAMFEGGFKVLALAGGDQAEAWSNGAIKLVRADGKVIATMESKIKNKVNVDVA